MIRIREVTVFKSKRHTVFKSYLTEINTGKLMLQKSSPGENNTVASVSSQ